MDRQPITIEAQWAVRQDTVSTLGEEYEAAWRETEADAFLLGLLDVVPQPGVDRLPVEVTRFHQPDEEPVVRHRVPAQLEAMHSKMHVSGRYRRPFVAVEKRMVLNQALEQSRRLCNRTLVVARLGSENCCLQRTQIPNTIGATELVDEDGVKCQDLDNAKVFGQLLGQLCVEFAMPGDRSLQVRYNLGSGCLTLLLGHPLGQRFVENGLKLTSLLSGQGAHLVEEFRPCL